MAAFTKCHDVSIQLFLANAPTFFKAEIGVSFHRQGTASSPQFVSFESEAGSAGWRLFQNLSSPSDSNKKLPTVSIIFDLESMCVNLTYLSLLWTPVGSSLFSPVHVLPISPSFSKWVFALLAASPLSRPIFTPTLASVPGINSSLLTPKASSL